MNNINSVLKDIQYLGDIRTVFLETSLNKKSGFDISVAYSGKALKTLKIRELPNELKIIKKVGDILCDDSLVGLEYDTSKDVMPLPSIMYRGVLPDGRHAARPFLELFDRGDETLGILKIAARLTCCGANANVLGIMQDRDTAVRLMATCQDIHGAYGIVQLLKDIEYPYLDTDMEKVLHRIIGEAVPGRLVLLHFDILPDGSFFNSLGVELTKECLPFQTARELGADGNIISDLDNICYNNTEVDYNTMKFSWKNNKLKSIKVYLRYSLGKEGLHEQGFSRIFKTVS